MQLLHKSCSHNYDIFYTFSSVPYHGGLKVSPDDQKLFGLLKAKTERIREAIKSLKGRKKADMVANDSD